MMKKIFIFLLGIVTGVILTILAAYLITHKADDKFSFFDQPGEVFNVKSFEVIQVIGKDCALAWEDDDYSHDLIVLLRNDEGVSYYDNQIVKAGPGKCFRQVGLYRYQAKNTVKTVPIVEVMDK